jgi:hypothetical protein
VLELPQRVEPLRLDTTTVDDLLIIDGIIEELSGDFSAIRVTARIKNDQINVFEARTIDSLRYQGCLKRVMSVLLKQSINANFKQMTFEGMLSTTEVQQRGATVSANGKVEIALQPPDTFAKWLLSLVDEFEIV